jgi:1-acyl-sn-glycerol-3-phosphate acyltransferase
MHKRRHTQAHSWFHAILRQTVGRYLKWRYSITAENLGALKNVPQPWLILPNHVMTWDPVIISIFVKQPIYFIASEANFRNRFASWWLRRVGAIPTSKQATDMTTLKQMMNLIREGKTVGLFPEGERTWDGVTIDIIPATAKLARLAKVPVVVPVIKGGFLSLPRWSYKSRRGPVTIEFKLAIGPEEIKQLKLTEIEKRISEAIHHDEFEYQKQQKRPYLHRNPAEPLQLSLFICPECRSMNQMASAGSRFYCRKCDWETQFSSYGYFRPVDHHRPYFESVRDWYRWQAGELEHQIRARQNAGDFSELFSDTPVEYSTGFKFNSLSKKGRGRLSADITGLKFSGRQKDISIVAEFPWSRISAINVVYQSQLEFYFEGKLHVFIFPMKDTSGYKYLAIGRIIE